MTTKKAQSANGQSTFKMEVTKSVAPKTATTAKKEEKQPTVEELKKKVQQLTAKLQAVPQDLENRIQYFNHKKDLIKKLGNIEATAENVQKHLDTLAELSAENEFTNKNYYLAVNEGSGYNREAVFEIKNPVIIAEVLTFLQGKVEAKANELRKAIEA